MRKNIPLLTHPLALAAGLSALLGGCSGGPQRSDVGFVLVPPPSASAPPPPPPAKP